MSSEGSISSGSRIRQFGLYRSIDARTEEFLRLSRKRQIRQGCACAAISTAITVTIVVVVIFVYEFSLNSEVRVDNTLRANWFSLINDTTEEGFETAFTKSNIDKTTLTLLPILLKALKKNVFLEKILEEQSSPSPKYEGTTEPNFEKNVFTKNWFRIPTSKLYAIAYKTSPIAYYKSPSKNLDYFTKIRKIRDYQRILNYVDKMISERVYIGSTKPMVIEEVYSEKPSKTMPLTKKIFKIKSIKAPKNSSKPLSTSMVSKGAKMKKDDTCKCPKKLGELLHKIMSSIEMLLPAYAFTKKNKTNCHHQKKIEQNNKTPSYSKPSVSKGNSIQITPSYFINYTQEEEEEEEENSKATEEQGENNTMPNINLYDIITPKLSNQDNDIITSYTKPTDKVYRYKKLWNQKSILNFFQKNYKIPDEIPPPVRLIDENEYDDFFNGTVGPDALINPTEKLKYVNKIVPQKVTANNTINNTTVVNKKIEIVTIKPISYPNSFIRNLNKALYHIIEKNKNIQLKPMPTKTTSIKPNTRVLTTKQSITNTNVTFELFNNKIYDSNEITPALIEEVMEKITPTLIEEEEDENITPALTKGELKKITPALIEEEEDEKITPALTKGELKKITPALIEEEEEDEKITPALTKGELKKITPALINEEAAKITPALIKEGVEKITRALIEEEVDTVNNLTQEDLLKPAESSLRVFNDTLKTNAPFTVQTEPLWEELNNENVPAWKSMMPSHRPAYLEMHQRNEWKHDEHDYDFNMNYDNIHETK